MMIAYVITWRYSDGSGSGPVSVHWSEAGAKTMLAILEKHCELAILEKHCDKDFAITPVPCEPLP